MPLVRNYKDFSKLPPDVWVNELPVPQNEAIEMSDFVLAVVGEFEKGPIDQYIYAVESPSRTLVEAVEDLLGKPSPTSKYPGNQVLEHIKNAKVKKCVFVNVKNQTAKPASIAISSASKAVLQIDLKTGPGEYGNLCSAEVVKDSKTNKLILNLYNDVNKKESYILSMDKNSDDYVVDKINNESKIFSVRVLADNIEFTPSDVMTKTQFTNGLNGLSPSQGDYVGTFNADTQKRTGLKLLETVGGIVTDVCYANYSSSSTMNSQLTPDEALANFGIKYNCMTYCGVGGKTTISNIISYRKEFDSDFMQMVYGRYASESGAEIDGATLSAIVHAVGNVEDSGLAVECHWITKAINDVDFDQQTELYENQIAAFVLKPSSKGDGSYAYRLLDDYTLAVTDVDGSLIADSENRKVNKRRINSWLEKALFAVSAPWQGKALTKPMKDAAAVRLRTFLEQLKTPLSPTETSKIEDYSITFDENAATIDQFVNTLKIKHYNTAEWVVLNYQGGTNVEV